MLLDYSEYITASRQLNDHQPPHQRDSGRIELFGESRESCPSCGIATERRILIDDYLGLDNPERHSLDHPWGTKCGLSHCLQCGWWALEAENAIHNQAGVFGSQTILLARSILRTFDWGAKDLPIQLLRSHLITNKEKLNLLDPTKMEQLVQSVFREHLDCEVTHCGRTADGGLDLYFIDGDEPVAVQIKARRHREKPEPVEGIREFLGAMMLKGYKAGVFVSSAGRFTKPATIAANQAVEMGLATRYELVDADRFLKLLELRYPGDQSPWVDCVNAHFQEIASKLKKGLPG